MFSPLKSKVIIQNPAMQNSNTNQTEHDSSETTIQNDGLIEITDYTYNSDTVYPDYRLLTASIDINEFLRRPIAITNGVFNKTNLRMDVLYSTDLLIAIAAQPTWYEKIKGLRNFRANIKIELMLNAMPFQAGLLNLKYIPFTTSAMRNLRYSNLTSYSQLPGLTMSCRQTACELMIPYRNPNTYATFLDAGSTWGELSLAVYSPLATGGGSETTCEYTIWMSLHDLEYAIPMVPQSTTTLGTSKRSKKIMRVSSLQKESNEGKGPVSKVLGGVASIAAGLGYVPVLKPIMGTLEWFSNIAAGIASSYGWSKPIISSEPCRMIADRHVYHCNSNAPDISNSLGLFADNQVAVVDDIGLNSDDEMSFASITQHWAFVGSFNWNTTTTAGTNLYYVDVGPIAWKPFPVTKTAGTITTSGYTPTPMGMIAMMHTYYTGGVEIKLRFVKTDYHSGRVLVAFNPQTMYGINYGNSPYAFREILDIRTKEEVCFTIPYTSHEPWSDVYTDVMGHFVVYVQTPLAVASACDATIEVLVEVRAAPDFQVALPRNTNILPFLPQSGDLKLKCEPIGGSNLAKVSEISQYTIGESIVSINQLCKRFTRIELRSSTDLSVGRGSLNPFALGGMSANNTIAPILGGVTGDYISLFSTMFAFWRGGVRIKLLVPPTNSIINGVLTSPRTSNNDVSSWIAPESQFSIGTGVPPPNLFNMHHAVAPALTNALGGISVQIPNYMQHRYRICTISYNYLNNTVTPFSPNLSMAWSSNPPMDTVSSNNTIFYRSGADDLQFGFFLGTLPVLTSYTST